MEEEEEVVGAKTGLDAEQTVESRQKEKFADVGALKTKPKTKRSSSGAKAGQDSAEAEPTVVDEDRQKDKSAVVEDEGGAPTAKKKRRRTSSGAKAGEAEPIVLEEHYQKDKSAVVPYGGSPKRTDKKKKRKKSQEPESSGREIGAIIAEEEQEPEILSWLYEKIEDPNQFFHKLLPPSSAQQVVRALEDVSPSYYLQCLEDFQSLSPDMLPILQTVRHIGEHVRLISMALQRHKKIVQRFSNFNKEDALIHLCDPSRSTKLELPSFSATKFSPPLSFDFVGRSKLRSLLQRIKVKSDIHFRGHPGRGKSYVLAALASYLHTYKQECGVVVYILLSRLVQTEQKLTYVLQALLLGFARHGEKQLEILACDSMEKLEEFCEKERPLFLIDEGNALDVDKKRTLSSEEDRRVTKKYLSWIVNRAVWCTTFKSEFMPTNIGFFPPFNQPFDDKEFASWLSGYNFKELDINDLLFYTGLIPRLLAEFVGKGDAPEEVLYRRDLYIAGMSRVFQYFVERMTMEEADAVEKVLDLSLEEIGSLELPPDIFFERTFGSKTVVSVLPFLENRLRILMAEKRRQAGREKDIQEFEVQLLRSRRLMEMDSDRQPNSSLNAWLAEGLVREYIRLKKKFLTWKFDTFEVYEEGLEGIALEQVSIDRLRKGVCFVTASSFDIVIAIMAADEKSLDIHPVQISVSSWNMKKVMDSYNLWSGETMKEWSHPSCTTRSLDFTYVLTNTEGANLDKVTLKTFGDVGKCLAFIDKLVIPQWKPC
ncbi:hypothetical protein SELMODRAFT_418749 [Selaginella moellendorffii]|uniref:Uncharacterized protein n=1 Tax=Selaginella moellendorffii TaxID=88036 RepID=D8S6A0_SELML|nr:hypothetical protein SELMODRAFT_418749 [Selaginella moellendorffii]